MQNVTLSGPGSGPKKYDLLTAMAVTGLSIGGAHQTTLFRLMALITARYNWASDTLSIGQREMATLWSVDERTAKRETKRMLQSGLLRVKKPGARGRVATYGLCVDHIYAMSEAKWAAIGPDFAERMAGDKIIPVPETSIVRVDFGTRRKLDADAKPWDRAMDGLAQSHPAQHRAWFAHLTEQRTTDTEVHAVAPTRFAARYIATHLLPMLETALTRAYGNPKRCILHCAAD